MKLALLALYGGPDQIMGVASGVATVVGVLLMLWNRILVFFSKIMSWFRPAKHEEVVQTSSETTK